MSEHDFGEVEEAAPDQLALLHRLVSDLYSSEQAVKIKERELAEAQAKYRKLREHDIPEQMLGMGMKELKTTDGLEVDLREEVRASMPKDADARKRAMDWLRDNGHDGIIKTFVSVQLGKGTVERAQEIWNLLCDYQKEKGVSLDVVRKEDVHNQTLCAFLREELRQGHEVPMDNFGAFVQKFANIKTGRK